MPAAGGEGLEKIEDMIVRAAESTAAHVRAAKAAIGTVIFGQDKVVEQALVTILSGGHAAPHGHYEFDFAHLYRPGAKPQLCFDGPRISAKSAPGRWRLCCIS